MSNELRVAGETDFPHLATREELNGFKSGLKSDIRQLEAKIEAKISETKSEIIKWHFGSFVAIIVLLTAILFKLH